MSKHARKEQLNEEQWFAINQQRNAQIATEMILVIFGLTLFTINIASVWPAYGNTDFIIMLLSAFALFICEIKLTISVFNLIKLGKPLKSIDSGLRSWIVIAWCWILVIIAVGILANTVASNVPLAAKGIAIGATILCFFVTMVVVLIKTQSIWGHFNKNKHPPVRPILYSVLGLVMLLLTIFGTYTTVDNIEYSSTAISDGNLELGQSEVRQIGKNGQKQTIHNLIFGFVTSTSQTDAVDQITAKGTRRYQYMYCSNGSYRYYTAEQFKNPDIGFTHQSPDNCASNGEGVETTLADVPPAKTVVQQNTVRSPSSFSCYSLYSGNVNCYGY